MAVGFDRNGLEFLGVKLDIVALADLVSFDDIRRIDFVAALGIYLAVFDAVPGLLVELMEADLLALRSGRKESNWT